MSVLVEAISVIVRKNTLEQKYPGGLNRYIQDCPNRTFCMDEHLTRIGFMTPSDVGSFIGSLQIKGLIFLHNGSAIDIAVVDQREGLTMPCDWIEFGSDPAGFSKCWLKGAKSDQVAVPQGWKLEGSLSASFNFIDAQKVEQQLQFLRQEDGIDVFFDKETGKEIYARHPHGSRRSLPLTASAKASMPVTPIVKRPDDWQVESVYMIVGRSIIF